MVVTNQWPVREMQEIERNESKHSTMECHCHTREKSKRIRKNRELQKIIREKALNYQWLIQTSKTLNVPIKTNGWKD